jgi:hypothetical protein
MFGRFKMRGLTGAVRDLARGLFGLFGVGGTYYVECYGADGSLRWRSKAKNAITNVGLNSLLDVYLRNQTQIATWYMGLIDNASFSALAAADTGASHAGWAENQDYSASTRPAWSPAAASSQAITNTSTVDFAMNADKTIRGIFLISNNTKGGTTGTLFSTATFSTGSQTVANGDTIKVTYAVNASST